MSKNTDVRSVAVKVAELSRRKVAILDELTGRCLDAATHLRTTLEYWDVVSDEKETRYNLHALEYNHIRSKYRLPSQVAIDVVRDVFAMYTGTGGWPVRYSPSFNNPRSGSLTTTRRGNPVVTVATSSGRTALPIRMDGSWDRLATFIASGYEFTSFRLSKDGDGWIVIFSLKKDIEPYVPGSCVVGVDLGSRTLAAVSVVDTEDNSVRGQWYFGRDVWERQRDISIRRGRLQAYEKTGPDGDKARRKLSKLRNKEHNFVTTRCYQVAHQIVNIAKSNGASIAVEDLTHLNRAPGNRKSRRKARRIPYRRERAALESVAKRERVPVVAVNPAYTSQLCPKCGNLGKRTTRNKIFVCTCGRKVNADRNASVNIAIRAGSLSRKSTSPQATDDSGPINGHVWRDDNVRFSGSYSHTSVRSHTPPAVRAAGEASPSGRGS